MIKLQGGCSHSELKVSPKNWQSCRTITKDWFIFYRFYDSGYKQQYPKGKLIVIKGMNKYKELQQRRGCALAIIDDEIEQLQNGFNPITKQKAALQMPDNPNELTKRTLFIDALNFAKKECKVSDNTMKGEIEWIVAQLDKAAKALKFEHIAVNDISLKHLYLICEKASYKADGSYSGDKFNRNKKVLRQLYKKLLILEVVPSNLPMSLERQKGAPRKKKVVLSKSEREKLVQYLEKNSPEFLIFIQIFFHSGARITEMLRLKVKDVDLISQEATYLVLKGRQYELKERPIKDIAVKYWKEAVKGAKRTDYVFSAGLLSGEVLLKENVIKKRWQRVEEKLSISGGIYRLKHTNTTEVSKILGTKKAAEMNAESEEMIIKHYDLQHEARAHDEIKKVNNPL